MYIYIYIPQIVSLIESKHIKFNKQKNGYNILLCEKKNELNRDYPGPTTMAGDDAVLCVVGVGTGCVCHLPSRDARRRLATFSGSTDNKIKIMKLFIYNHTIFILFD